MLPAAMAGGKAKRLPAPCTTKMHHGAAPHSARTPPSASEEAAHPISQISFLGLCFAERGRSTETLSHTGQLAELSTLGRYTFARCARKSGDPCMLPISSIPSVMAGAAAAITSAVSFCPLSFASSAVAR